MLWVLFIRRQREDNFMPGILVFAGPNGSGKSTITSEIDIVGQYVNANEIKKDLNCS